MEKYKRWNTNSWNGKVCIFLFFLFRRVETNIYKKRKNNFWKTKSIHVCLMHGNLANSYNCVVVVVALIETRNIKLFYTNKVINDDCKV